MSSFTQRLLLQKRMFLLSMLGIDLGHVHSWYIRGPYSPALTRDAFAVVAARNGGSTATASLPDPIIAKIDKIGGLFGAAWNDPKKLELLSSVFYLARTYRTNDVKFLSNRLTSLKPNFSEEDAVSAIDWLTKHEMLDV